MDVIVIPFMLLVARFCAETSSYPFALTLNIVLILILAHLLYLDTVIHKKTPHLGVSGFDISNFPKTAS
jgi:hypothetical protein